MKWQTIALWGVAALYLIWGVDLVPDIVPLVGRLDDAAVILGRLALQMKFKI